MQYPITIKKISGRFWITVIHYARIIQYLQSRVQPTTSCYSIIISSCVIYRRVRTECTTTCCTVQPRVQPTTGCYSVTISSCVIYRRVRTECTTTYCTAKSLSDNYLLFYNYKQLCDICTGEPGRSTPLCGTAGGLWPSLSLCSGDKYVYLSSVTIT